MLLFESYNRSTIVKFQSAYKKLCYGTSCGYCKLFYLLYLPLILHFHAVPSIFELPTKVTAETSGWSKSAVEASAVPLIVLKTPEIYSNGCAAKLLQNKDLESLVYLSEILY